MSRSQVVKLIENNSVKLNGKPLSKKNIPVEPGAVLELELPAADEAKAAEKSYKPTIDFHKMILYEDEHLLIIDKPCHISVHPGSGAREETILDLLRYHYPPVDQIKTLDSERPGIVHRLDKDTSGVMLLAKDAVTMKKLQKQFKRREVRKTYMALVEGHLRYRSGTVDLPIARSQRNRTRFKVVEYAGEENPKVKDAVTRYRLIREYAEFSLVKIFPLTGRTHQIRVHFSHLRSPVLGDPVYGNKNTFERLALHAYTIEFQHPVTGQLIEACVPFPPVFREFLRKQAKKTWE